MLTCDIPTRMGAKLFDNEVPCLGKVEFCACTFCWMSLFSRYLVRTDCSISIMWLLGKSWRCNYFGRSEKLFAWVKVQECCSLPELGTSSTAPGNSFLEHFPWGPVPQACPRSHPSLPCYFPVSFRQQILPILFHSSDAKPWERLGSGPGPTAFWQAQATQ